MKCDGIPRFWAANGRPCGYTFANGSENAIFTFIFHSAFLHEKRTSRRKSFFIAQIYPIPPGIIKLKNTTSAARKIYTYFASGAKARLSGLDLKRMKRNWTRSTK